MSRVWLLLLPVIFLFKLLISSLLPHRNWWGNSIGGIAKARRLWLELEHHLPDRSIAMLGHDQVRIATPLRFWVVDLIAINKHDDIGVILDPSRLSQV